MPTLADVYRKFGETAEAGQLLETQLGNVLLSAGIIEADLIVQPDIARATELLDRIDRQTLGQLLRTLNRSTDSLAHLETLLQSALTARNRLTHSFYRRHNFRRNSDEGRAIMLKDLEQIHTDILAAYRGVVLLSGVDIFDHVDIVNPTKHVPI
jgi:hypothetical protein